MVKKKIFIFLLLGLFMISFSSASVVTIATNFTEVSTTSTSYVFLKEFNNLDSVTYNITGRVKANGGDTHINTTFYYQDDTLSSLVTSSSASGSYKDYTTTNPNQDKIVENITMYFRHSGLGSTSWETNTTVTGDSGVIFYTLNNPENNTLGIPGENLLFNVTSIIYGGNTLLNMSLYINGILNETKPLSGTEDTQTFTKSFSTIGNYNWTVQSCDNESVCSFSNYRYFTISAVKELNLTYNTEVLDLSIEDFVLYVNATEEITSAKLNYAGTDYSSSLLFIGNGLYKISNSIQIPSVVVDTNQTFYFNITTTNSSFTTNSYNQSVFVLMIDNCGSYTNELFNITLYDEKTLLSLLGTIEVNLELFNSDKTTALTTTEDEFYNMSNMQICSNINLTDTGYYYDLELRYYVDPTNTSTFLYVPEFYHIQKATTSGFTQDINLYNLNINQSTEFTMFYRDNDYVARPNVLLQIERKYISEGIYRVVEIPITSSEGSAIGHFDLNNYKYRIVATENGVILNTFDNPAIVCESELSGTCTLSLNGQGNPDAYRDYEEIQDISYSVRINGTEITVEYVIPSGETKQISVSMVQQSAFANAITLCNQTLTSSAGSFTCTANSTIGDSNVVIEILSDGDFVARTSVYYQEDLGDFFNLNNYVIAAFFLILLVTMMVSSPKIMTVTAVFSVALLGLTFLLKGSSIGLVLGSFSWLVIAGILILIKINKKDET